MNSLETRNDRHKREKGRTGKILKIHILQHFGLITNSEGKLKVMAK
jgi:hypothetical protein